MASQEEPSDTPTPATVRIGGCVGCAGSDRPGYNTVWVEDGGQMRPVWTRCTELCTQESRAAAIERGERLRAEQTATQQAAKSGTPRSTDSSSPPQDSSPARASAELPVRQQAPTPPSPVYRWKPARRSAQPTQQRRTPARPSTAAASSPSRWAAVALDHTGEDWRLDVAQVPAPAGSKLGDWLAWLGTGLPLRVDRLHTAGRAGDGMVCLSAAAAAVLGLPAQVPTAAKALAGLQGKLAKAAAAAGMETSEEVGPVFHAFRRKGAPGGPKTSVRVIVTPWLGQGTAKQQITGELLATLATDDDGQFDAVTLARRLRAFVADLGVAPGVTPATTSKLLLDAVRPRYEPHQDEHGTWRTRLREGALPGGDTTVPPAAGARHPATRELLEEREAVCEEEDFKWWARPLTQDEAAMGWAVAVDVCASYLSVTMSLPLPAGSLEHTTASSFDGKTAGLWWADFTHVAVDELLPHPATFHGQAPTGPGWYATPTVAYMAQTYGFDPATISEAYVATATVPLLKEWTTKIREAYKQAYGALGLVDGQAPEAFLHAYAAHKHLEPGEAERGDAAVLAGLYKAVYKGGIGKWADSARHLDYDAWAAKVAGDWSYRPEIRFHIIAAARIAAHRRMRKTLNKTGRAPFAVNVDSYLYATHTSSPLELLTPPENGKPVAGVLRLGIAPGSSKHEASIPLQAARELMDAGEHPGRLTHDYDTSGNELTDDAHRR